MMNNNYKSMFVRVPLKVITTLLFLYLFSFSCTFKKKYRHAKQEETTKTDEVLFQDNSTQLKCLHNGIPPEYDLKNKHVSFGAQRLDTNDMSLVLKLETADNSFLFPADISAAMAKTLVSEKRNLQADILLAPHHGSRSSMSFDFIKAVEPEYIAISAGRNNLFNFPDKSFFELEQKGIQIVTTGRDGTFTFTGKEGKTLLSRYQIN